MFVPAFNMAELIVSLNDPVYACATANRLRSASRASETLRLCGINIFNALFKEETFRLGNICPGFQVFMRNKGEFSNSFKFSHIFWQRRGVTRGPDINAGRKGVRRRQEET